MTDVTIGLAFVAGLISFISPCVLPLVPAYIGYMGGRLTRQIAQHQPPAAHPPFRQRFGLLVHGVFFVLGFTLFFVIFGLLTTAAVSSLTSLGATESEVRDGLARVGGTMVILFGLHIMGVLNRVFAWLLKQTPKLDRSAYGNLISALVALAFIGLIYWMFVESWFLTLVVVLVLIQLFHDALKADTPGEFWSRIIQRLQTALYVDTRRQSQPHGGGYLGSMFMGVVFSAGWTPCIGPIYGAVLTMASSGESLSKAGTLLTAYALGLGIPFLLTALALDRAQGLFRRLQRNMRAIEAFSGTFLIALGVLVFTGQLQRLAALGSGEGSLGRLSLNLENCTVAVLEGRVRPGNWAGCVGDGVKEAFYIAAPKETAQSQPVAVAQLPGTGEGTASQAPPAASGGGVGAPDLAAGSGSAGAASVPVGLEVGQRAPDFTAHTLDGQTVSLSSYRGQVVLLNFWATWCEPCSREMPDFQAIYSREQANGFVVLAVNNQEAPADVRPFVQDRKLTFPILLDESGAINGSIYGDQTQGYPTTFLIDQNGVIVRYFLGAVNGPDLLDTLDDLLK